MKSFLYELAEKTVRDHPNLDKLTFVFPNRRAIIYFRKHLTDIISGPVFSPHFTTIEDFIGNYSSYDVPDKLELVHRLYRSYYQVLAGKENLKPETFDKFYFWGDMLLRDFDEVDKYMVSATQLFKDLSSQKELDSGFDFLTDDQVRFLKDFWGNFDEDLTANKQKFLHVWRQLPEVYQAFKTQLREAGLAYEGMLHREVAERITEIVPTAAADQKIVFAGFNALTITEEKIIAAFVNRGLAEVHWDLDDYYVNNNTQEAGRFFRQYQEHSVLSKTFPSDTPSNFNAKKNVRIVGAAQNVGQTKILAQLLDEQIKKNKINPEETLIVLPDEKLLLPVLHGISASVEKLNVTMGFPLASTPVFNLIEFLAELQAGRKDGCFNHRHVLSVIGHPYVLGADPVHANNRRREIIEKNKISIAPDELTGTSMIWKEIFVVVNAGGLLAYLRQVLTALGSLSSLTVLDKEFAFHFLKLINRFEEVTGDEIRTVDETNPEKRFQSELKSFLRLFRQLVRTQKIPFTGEPLRGLQLMGVLETRNLDYKNVFVLSLNEGALPSAGNKASYIPFNIRKAYGLPTAEHQDAFYAYLFYRSLQRAENIFLFYNTETDVLGQGEMSRYLQQIIYESGWTPTQEVLHNPIQPRPIYPIEIKKDETVLANLAKLNEGNFRFKGISPSALNTYIECQLQFYLKHIAKIREASEVEEDLDARWLGNILHDVMELFYRGIQEKKKSSLIEADDLKNYEAVTDKLIDNVFIKNYSLDPKRKVVYEGQRLVVREVVKGFIARIIKYDRDYAPFSIEGLEHQGLLYYVPISHGPGQAVIGGKIDRLDKKGDSVRVIDYKTGRDKLEFDDIESLFSREGSRNKAAFQILLYALLYNENHKGASRIKPGLINRLNLFEEEFRFGLIMNKEYLDDAVPLLDNLKAHLKILLEELFNPEETFKQTSNVDNCKFCAYQRICYR
jgi:CRISPR/Cas system-associated exonuclease Cas4 (RecB family)